VIWIPITLAAAAFQTARNALQRSLTGALSQLGATYTRFLFGLPFALLYAAAVFVFTGADLPSPHPVFLAWATLGGVAQIFGTAFLLRLFTLRNFATGIAFSKSEILQVALVGMLALGDSVTTLSGVAIGVATLGLLLLSRETRGASWRGLAADLTGRAAVLGLATGAAFAVAAVSFRAASLSLGHPSFAVSAAVTLVVSLLVQSLLMTLYLRWREPGQVGVVLGLWRRSLFPGLTGAAASACWFSAMTLEIAAYVRMLGLIEVLFGYGVAVLGFRERPSPRENTGTVLLVAAIAALLWDRAQGG
jgi:drug/metabolite transporter (DMT)-like permease